MKSTRLLLSVAALSTGLIFSGGTLAEDWEPVGQVGFFGAGKAYEIRRDMFIGSANTPARSSVTRARKVCLTTLA